MASAQEGNIMSRPNSVVLDEAWMTQVSHQQWGEVAGLGRVDLWVLQSSLVRVEVLTLGAIIRSVCSRGRDGRMEDVVLGYDDLEGYVSDQRYLGAAVGRVANRIALGRFVVEGREHILDVNNGPNALHGGLRGFNKICRLSVVHLSYSCNLEAEHHEHVTQRPESVDQASRVPAAALFDKPGRLKADLDRGAGLKTGCVGKRAEQSGGVCELGRAGATASSRLNRTNRTLYVVVPNAVPPGRSLVESDQIMQVQKKLRLRVEEQSLGPV
ncbi:Aldose 1-epimerase [Liparis tanakae]|uniref:Galactose mutarotase n=1 Tax=Liparis tanakae TaxID=230148 RepID=A0A4Z2GC85_9TELE|nr:Aldose 1-epimerase [Liparis tanakae]